MRMLKIASLVAAAFVISAHAHADTVSFASTAGTTTYTYVSGHAVSGTSSGSSVAYYNGAYAAPMGGSAWISTDCNGGDGMTNSVTNYTDTLTLAANETYTGSLSFYADDTANVLVNGVQVFTGSSSNTFYGNATTVTLLASYFHSGTNTITLQDKNSGGGPAAVDFSGSLTGTAVTPEPSSLALLGTGAIGAAGMLRRRFHS